MYALVDFLRSDDVPWMARPNYRAERRHMLFWAVFANLVDGTFSSIVVAKTFHASPLLVSLVWSTPLLAHIASFAWGVLLRGQPRIRTFAALAACAVGCVASVALTPPADGAWSGWIFAGQIALARIFLSGLVTIRSSVWAANYPVSHRARIAGRIQMLNGLLMVATGATVSLLFDQHPEYYRFVYPLVALLGLISLVPLRRIRVRGERRELRRFRDHLVATGAPQGYGWAALKSGVREALAILRNDKPFAQYCTAQYFLGSANFMVDPILTVVLTSRLKLSYFECSLLMDQVPTCVMLLTVRSWAHLFDRIGVLQFRVINSAIWLASIVGCAGAMFLIDAGARSGAAPALSGTFWGWAALGVLVASRLVNGIGRGGGAIAWNIGHLHFAGEHQKELYMGIHVTLTGLRGLVMPAVGTVLYNLVGSFSFLLAIASAVWALVLFRRLVAQSGAAAEGAAEPGPPELAPADAP